MRNKVIAAVLFISVFAMNANAYCVNLCAGGHVHAKSLTEVATDKNGQMAHFCHHFPQDAATTAHHHDSGQKDNSHICHTSIHEKDGHSAPTKLTKIDRSLPVIECNCIDEAGLAASQVSVALTARVSAPSASASAVTVATTAYSRPVLSELVPPERPPRNTL